MANIIYVHDAAESFVSKAIKILFRITRRKRDLVNKYKPGAKPDQNPALIPKSLRRIATIEEREVQGRPVWILRKKDNPSSKMVFFTHGGGHINNLIFFHWKTIEYLMLKTGAGFTVVDYPLLPQTDFEDTYGMVEDSFKSLVNEVKSEDLIFMGDSAGGALALGVAMLLRDQKYDIQPSQIILISPELDGSQLLPEVADYEKYDTLLDKELLKLIFEPYSKGKARDQFLISPGLGSLHDLGKISLFTGTHDILYPYITRLRERLDEGSYPYNYFEYPKMAHDWAVVTWMPEAKVALDQMARIIG